MDNLIENRKYKLRKKFYFLLSIFYILISTFLIILSIRLCKKMTSTELDKLLVPELAIAGIVGMIYLLIKIYQNWKKTRINNQFLKLGLYRNIKVAIVEIISNTIFIFYIIVYFDNYNNLYCYIFNVLLCCILGVFLFLCIIIVWFYGAQIIYFVLMGILVYIVAILLGVLTSSDFSLEACIFLVGLLFAVIENIEKFIKLDNYYPDEIVTLENDTKIKRNKIVLNLSIGILFMLIYIIIKVLSIESIKMKIMKYIKFDELYAVNNALCIGLMIILILEILIILISVVLIMVHKVLIHKEKNNLNRVITYIKENESENIVERVLCIVFIGLRSKVSPKVIQELAIGECIIDEINPEVFIENRREIPKGAYIILSKDKNSLTTRNLIIIYPNKEVYKCEFKVGKNTVTRVADVEKVNCVENNVTD